MAWYLMAPSHYLSQCWRRSMLPYDITRPQATCITKTYLAPERFTCNSKSAILKLTTFQEYIFLKTCIEIMFRWVQQDPINDKSTWYMYLVMDCCHQTTSHYWINIDLSSSSWHHMAPLGFNELTNEWWSNLNILVIFLNIRQTRLWTLDLGSLTCILVDLWLWHVEKKADSVRLAAG